MVYVRYAKGSLIGAPGLIPLLRDGVEWPFGPSETYLSDTTLNPRVQIDGIGSLREGLLNRSAGI
jgi:hypothetical protein